MLFSVPDHRISYLRSEDIPVIQHFLEQCNDFNILITGLPVSSNDSNDLLLDHPKGVPLKNKLTIEIYNADNQLIAISDTIRDYPEPGIWWIGLLLILPIHRNKGLGSLVYKSMESWINRSGASDIMLGVIEENIPGKLFWTEMGFTEIQRRPKKKFGIKDHVVIVMKKHLSPSGNSMENLQ